MARCFLYSEIESSLLSDLQKQCMRTTYTSIFICVCIYMCMYQKWCCLNTNKETTINLKGDVFDATGNYTTRCNRMDNLRENINMPTFKSITAIFISPARTRPSWDDTGIGDVLFAEAKYCRIEQIYWNRKHCNRR